ncbi:ArnT family glycosyltransferase [Plantactinospora sp. WMMC1484]|uniref:ArnT family glycosyltransferase n=1 Tax=Plantactinospora sp. WMMC1484 TaxID=3404122 RepID=UPI003BF4FAB6
MSVAVPRGGRLVRSLDRPGAVALGLGLLGLGYRLVLVLLTVPGSNSDEATFGLAALHIAAGEELPVFLYGQHYMGTVQSYLAAPLFLLFGAGWVPLRIPLLLLYAAFVYLTYRLTRRLYSPWLATFTVGVLALGGERVVRDQITAVGGRPEVKPAVLGLLLIALALGQRRSRHRWWGFGLFGLLTGLCVWDDWLILPYLAVAFGVLLLGCWRELVRPAGALLVGGFLLGVAPLIVDNVTAPDGQDSISVLRQVSAGETESTPGQARLHGALLVGVPLATGLCRPERCDPVEMSWGGIYLALLLAAGTLAVRGLARPGGGEGAPAGGACDAVRATRIGYATRLALVLGAALTLAAYARSSLAGDTPLASARYLSILQISLPAVLWPLWLLARRAGRLAAGPVTRIGGILASAVLALLMVLLLGTTAHLIGEIGTIRAEERQQRELARTLQRAGVEAVYAEYWTCNRLVFVTRERVACAVLGADLRPGQDRYPAYPRRVRDAGRPAYVFEVGTPAEAAVRAHLRRSGVAARVIQVGRHRIYLPAATLRPPG